MCGLNSNAQPIAISFLKIMLFPLFSTFMPVGRPAFVHLYQVSRAST